MAIDAASVTSLVVPSESLADGKSAAATAAAVRGRMHFLTRDPKYDREKPYTLRYAPPPESGIPQTNIERVEHPLVFRDFRGRDDLRYDECGFGVVTLPKEAAAAEAAKAAETAAPPFSYDDYAHADRIEGVHAPQVLDAVRRALGAASAELIDYVVRRRHATWPVSTGEPYAFQQPASRAHIDHTYAGGVAVIKEAHGGDADAVLSRRWQLVK